MTAGEKKRMLGIVRTVECFLCENLALKAVLTSHRIPMPVWQEECDKLMDDPEHLPEVHVKFQHIYDEIGRARDGTKAFEALLEDLPKPKKAVELSAWNEYRRRNLSPLRLAPLAGAGAVRSCFLIDLRQSARH